MKVEVSVGEAIDKLSILELKMKKINDENKKIEVEKEIAILVECAQYKTKYDFYFNLLMYVNEKIWDMTDIIKNMQVDDNEFSTISNKIFEFNQKRFRIKNWFNLLTSSNIKEQKSYASSHCKILLENEDVLYNKLPEIVYLALEYDFLTFDISLNNETHSFLKIPTIIYNEEQKNNLSQPIVVVLADFSIPQSEPKSVFSLKPITYIIGGMFGDFIQSLSVICEKFYETGRKGTLYISDRGDTFRNGVENTFNDVFPLLIKQKYIHDFKIYNNEPFEIDLSLWRFNVNLKKQSWYHIYNQTYNVTWGKNKWMDAPFEDKWKDKIIVNTTDYRWACFIDFNLLKNIHANNLIFVSSDKNQHNFFESNTGISIEFYQPKNFSDLCTIINSCKFFVGSFSGPLSIAHAFHKKRIMNIGQPSNEEDYLMNCDLDKFLPNIIPFSFSHLKTIQFI
jgi:hypothetical protein